jgi:hypothetical protein
MIHVVPFWQVPDKSLDVGLRKPEIDQQPNTDSSCFQIIEDPCSPDSSGQGIFDRTENLLVPSLSASFCG